VAHGLARAAGNDGFSRIWMEEIPDIIHDVCTFRAICFCCLEFHALGV
jgi:hypothetical protein